MSKPSKPAASGRAPAWRRSLAGLAGAAAVIALVGCGQVDAALRSQSAVVSFKPGTSRATLASVRQACSHVPNARPAASRSGKVSLRFTASKATAHDLAELRACLQRFPAVTGLTLDDTAKAF